MTHDRHDRVASLIRELAASFIQEEANTNPMITVTNLHVSSDYRKVTIFITTVPDGKEQDALIFLKRKGTELRTYIKKKSDLKIIPHLDFMIDAGERHRQHIDEISREIEGEKKD